MTSTRKDVVWVGFGLAALYALMVGLVQRGVVAQAPGPMGFAVTFDLTVTASLATWWWGARAGRLHRRAPFVVLALGFMTARLILPPEAREGLLALRLVWAAVELVVMALLIAQMGRIRRQFRALRLEGAAPLDALSDVLAPLIGALMAGLISSELGVLGYALGGWTRPTPVEDARTFSMHRRSHYGVIVCVFVFLILGESVGLHFLVARWSVAGAWLLTASSLWVMLWMVGDAQALRLSPLIVTSSALEVSVGIRWRVRVPWQAVKEIGAANGERTGATLRATAAGPADVRITLARPLIARGLLGRRRSFDALDLSVDRPDELIAATRGFLPPA